MTQEVPVGYGPREKAVPGDRIRQHLSADQYNYQLAGAELAQHTARNTPGNVPETNIGNEPDICLVLNDSGTDLERGDIIALEAPMIEAGTRLESWWQHRAFRGIRPVFQPQWKHPGRIGILWEPIADGKIGRIVVSGVAHVRLVIRDSNHEYGDVDPINGGHKLTTTDAGSACCQILEVEDTTANGGTCGTENDTRWAKVRIQNGGAFTFVGKVTTAFSAFQCDDGGSGGTLCPPRGVVQVYWLNPSTECLQPLLDRTAAPVYICPYNIECRQIPIDNWVRIHCDRFFTWWATAQPEQTAMLRAETCIYPGDDTGTAKVQRHGALGYEDDPGFPDPVTIDNTDCLLFALPGELFRARRDGCCTGDWYPDGPAGLIRRVMINDCIECDKTGKAYVLQTSCSEGSGSEGDCGGPQTAECDITVCNSSGRPIAPCGLEFGVAYLNPGTGDADCCWNVIPGPFPTRATAALSAKMCPDDSEVYIEDVNFPTMCLTTSWTKPTKAKNPYGLAGCEDAKVELALTFVGCECDWDIIQVQPKALDILADIRMDCKTSTCTLEKKVYVQALVWSCDDTVCEESAGWDVVATGTVVDFVSAIECSAGGSGENCSAAVSVTTQSGCVFCAGSASTSNIFSVAEITYVEDFDADLVPGSGEGANCNVTANRKTACVLTCGESVASAGAVTVLEGTSILVSQGAYDDGCLKQTQVEVCVLAVGTPVDDAVPGFTCDDCEEGSGGSGA